MRYQIVTRGVPTLLVLMAVAVILILAGAASVGLTLGLAVAGTAGILLVSAVLYEVTNSNNPDRPRQGRGYRRPQVKGY
jgi:hypothetical protein